MRWRWGGGAVVTVTWLALVCCQQLSGLDDMHTRGSPVSGQSGAAGTEAVGVAGTDGRSVAGASTTAGGSASGGLDKEAGGTDGTDPTPGSSGSPGGEREGGEDSSAETLAPGGEPGARPVTHEGAAGNAGYSVGDAGFVTVCGWSGYSWTVVSPEETSSITPVGSFERWKAGEPLCTSGSVGADEAFGYAELGINIGQPLDGGPDDNNGTVPDLSGLYVSLSLTVTSSIRIQIEDTTEADSADHRWCAKYVGPGVIPWSDFNTTCWNNQGSAYSGQPINAVAMIVPGDDDKDVPFDFCVNAIGPSSCLGGELVETEETPPPVIGAIEMIDDLDDGNIEILELSGRSSTWYRAYDTTPGGEMTVETAPGGVTSKSRYAIHAYGSGFTDWGANADMGLRTEDTSILPYDATDYDGITFWLRAAAGSATSIRFMVQNRDTWEGAGVCTECWDAFGADLVAGTTWRQYAFRWSDLHQQGYGDPLFDELDASTLMLIGWQVGPNKAFDFWIDDVAFFWEE
ncbi:MAG: hypothetical protein JW940_27700 [Polyangiaceae bacterium]|nr:hypothetical protein [Polyangiaceae bacterium]